ncbi:17337_t:CDS:2, partial [Dentiscutata erythropus]
AIDSDNPNSSETDELSSQQIQKKCKFTKKRKNTTLSDFESETKEKLLSQKTPITKPPSLKWYNLAEILSVDYKNAMREFITRLWTSNTPEYPNNPDFPECIGDWAIKMMCRSINQQHMKF